MNFPLYKEPAAIMHITQYIVCGESQASVTARRDWLAATLCSWPAAELVFITTKCHLTNFSKAIIHQNFPPETKKERLVTHHIYTAELKCLDAVVIMNHAFKV